MTRAEGQFPRNSIPINMEKTENLPLLERTTNGIDIGL
jgi:hypothetical protein